MLQQRGDKEEHGGDGKSRGNPLFITLTKGTPNSTFWVHGEGRHGHKGWEVYVGGEYVALRTVPYKRRRDDATASAP